MMQEYKNYSINSNRIKHADCVGFEMNAESELICMPNETRRHLFLGVIDSAEEDCQWGRMTFQMDVEDDMIVNVVFFAQNESQFIWKENVLSISNFLTDITVDKSIKKRLFDQASAKRVINSNDILLYEAKGRYLYLYLEVIGVGNGKIGKIRINTPGDTFLQTFPEIYRSNGEFFHRYLSVFSSLYNDFQDEIGSIADKLDFDTAPVELLSVFGSWLGIELDGNFLGEEKMRQLLKEAYHLNQIKGTKQALERVAEILLDKKVIILEKNRMKGNLTNTEKTINEQLYGNSPFDITLLIKGFVGEEEKSQLFYLLNQFKPIRCKTNIVFLQESGYLDSYCYLDVNAKIHTVQCGILDENSTIDGMFVLQ